MNQSRIDHDDDDGDGSSSMDEVETTFYIEDTSCERGHKRNRVNHGAHFLVDVLNSTGDKHQPTTFNDDN